MKGVAIAVGVCLGAGFAGFVLTAPLTAVAQGTGTMATEPQGPPAPPGTNGQQGGTGQPGQQSHTHAHHHGHHGDHGDKSSAGNGTTPSQGQQ